MAKDYAKFTFTRDDGQTLQTGLSQSKAENASEIQTFGLLSASGFEFPEYEVFTEAKGVGDGAFVTGKRVAPRAVEIHLKPWQKDPATIFSARKTLTTFFTPNHTYTINVITPTGFTDAGTWTAETESLFLYDAELTAASWPTVQADEWNPEAVLQFIAPDPWLRAAETSVSFPSITSGTQYSSVRNNGDVATWPVMRLTCTTAGAGLDGSVWTVTVELNGYSFKIINPLDYTWHVGDTVDIYPETGLEHYDGTAPGTYLTHAPDPVAFHNAWKLQPGDNQARVISTKAAFDVEIIWNEGFAGI